jgi:hypothetical protein
MISRHHSDPFHPLEIVAFACAGLVLAVLLTMLAANKLFGQEFGFSQGWIDFTTGKAVADRVPAKR